ncbi:hypothetical protein [Granulicella sibirica]|uniref:hypothetical protein n=1 Tax=Granulicella sibirica TaxID=2479048 RepID=UPI00100887F9|nr:hypothetical protein [Granulicella sibirica]
MLKGESAVRRPSHCLFAFVHLAALLMLWMSVAQATHHHGSWTGGTEAHASDHRQFLHIIQSNDSELTCPLCMAGHSTLLAFAVLTERLQVDPEPLSICLEFTEPALFWSFDLFGRPPPSLESLAV